MLQEKSFGSVKIISLNRDALLAILRGISREICDSHPEVVSVHLFGSLARGDQVGTSDVDVLILVREVGEANPVDLILRYYPYFRLPVGVDLLVLEARSFQERLRSGDAFIARVWGECLALAVCND